MTMSGWMKKYKDSLAKTGEPIRLDCCPKIKMDLPGLMEYAKKQGKQVIDLTEEEKKVFIIK